MSSSKYFIPQFKGLRTNDNIFNVEEGAMLVANNIVLTRQNIIEPRHALTPVKLETSVLQPAYRPADNKVFRAMYAWHAVGKTAYVLPYSNTSSGEDNIGVTYGDQEDPIETYDYEEGKIASAPYPQFDSAAGVNWTRPRFVESKDQLFVTAGNGVWRTRSDAPTAVNNNFTRANVPFVAKAAVAAVTTSTTADDSRWLLPGQEVAIAVVISKKVSSQQSVYGRFSSIYRLRNTAAASSLAQPGVAVGVTVTPGKFSEPGDTIEIYRSFVYDIGTPPPPLSLFRLAYRSEQTVSAFSNQSQVILVGNDFFLNAEGIPTAQGILESLIPGGPAISPGVQLPVAKDATSFQNYAWFANIQRAAFARLQLNSTKSTVLGASTTLTVDNGLDNGNDLAIAFFGAGIIQSNAAAGTAYATTDSALSFVGSITNTNIRVDSTKIGAHLVGRSAAVTRDNGDNVAIVYDASGDSLDLGKFPLTNGIVLAYNNTQTRTEAIFTYESLDITTTAGTATFKSVAFAGGLDWTVGVGTDVYHFWFLPGSSMNNLPVYAGNGSTFYSMLPEPQNIQQAIGTVAAQSPGSWSIASSTLQLTVQMLGLTARTEGQLIRDTLTQVADVVNSTSGSNIFMSVNFYDQREFVLEAYNPSTTSIAVNLNAGQAAFSPTVTTTGGAFTTVSDTMQVINGIVPSAINLPNQLSRTFYLAPLTVGDSGRQITRLAATTNDLFVFKEREGIYRFNITTGGQFPVIQDYVLVDNTTYLIADESVQEIDEAIYFLSQKGFYRLTSTSLTKISNPIDIQVKRTISKSNLAQVRSFGNEYRKFYGCFFPDTEVTGSGTVFVYDTLRNEWYTWNDVVFEDAVLDEIQNKLTLLTKDLRLNTFFTSTVTADDTTDRITVNDGTGPISDLFVCQFSTSGTLPAGLVPNTNYWIIKDNNTTTLRVATSRANAEAGTFVDITTTGSGTHTMRVIVPDTASIATLGLNPNEYTWQYLRQERFTGEDFNEVVDNTFAQVININGNQVFTADMGANNPDTAIDQVEYQSISPSAITNPTGGAWTALPVVRLQFNSITQSTVYDNLEDLASFVFGKELFFFGAFNGSTSASAVPVTIDSIEPLDASGTTAIIIRLPSHVKSYSPQPTLDFIAVGVNADVQFRPIHAGSPNTNKRFSEFGFTTQDFPSTYLKMAFAVDTVANFTEDVVFSTVLLEQQIFRCFIPIDASRGRFLRVRMRHNTPQERFAINGSSIVLTQTNNTTTTKAGMR